MPHGLERLRHFFTLIVPPDIARSAIATPPFYGGN